MVTLFHPKGATRYAHQRQGLRFLIERKGVAALLFDPGLGKTATVLDYLSLLALHSRAEIRVLVIAPKVAVDTWVLQSDEYVHDDVTVWAEALGGSIRQRAQALASRGGKPYRDAPVPRAERRSGPRTLHHSRAIAHSVTAPYSAADGLDALPLPRLILEVVNIDTLSSRQQISRSKTSADLLLDAVRRFSPEVLVVDESHLFKGNGSHRSRLLDRVAQLVPRRILLTGTVMPHSPLDVFAQWRALDPTAFGTLQHDGTRARATYEGFRRRYANMGGYMGREVKSFKNLDDMQNVMAQRALVVLKEDALDLPADLDVKLPVVLSPDEAAAYADLKNTLVAQLRDGALVSTQNRLAQLSKLRQVTSGFIRDENGVDHILGTSKADVIASLIHDTLGAEKRIVVFALFRREISLLADRIARAGTEVMVIDGSTSDDDRIAMRLRFGSDAPERIVLIAQIKTMSLAVNELITARHAVFASLSQQRDDIVQARDRLHRIGQRFDCTFWFALAPNTADMAIFHAYRQRSNMEHAVLRHLAGEPDEEGA